MKPLLLLAITLLIAGCCENHEPIIVSKRTDINYSGDSLQPCMCSYFYDGYGRRFQNFIDSCSLYHVGDTIK